MSDRSDRLRGQRKRQITKEKNKRKKKERANQCYVIVAREIRATPLTQSELDVTSRVTCDFIVGGDSTVSQSVSDIYRHCE